MTNNLPISDLKQLLVFKEIYRRRNLSRVAEVMEMSQPAISSILKKLRETLDDPLFERHGNVLEPTPKAHDIIDPIDAAIRELGTALEARKNFDPQTDTAKFRFILADPLEGIVLPHLIDLIGENGGINFELLPPQIHDVEAAILSGTAHAGVLSQPLSRDSNLRCEALFPTDLVAIVRKGHPDYRPGPDVSFLLKQKFATLNMSATNMQNSSKLLFWQRMNINFVCHLPRLGSVAELVSKTDLAGVLPRFHAIQVAEKLNLEIVDLPMKMGEQQVFLIWNSNTDNRVEHIWLRQGIRDACAQATCCT